MKNLNSLVIISCLLVVLVGGCKSAMFDSDKEKTTPTATPTATATPSPNSTPKEHGVKPTPDETPGNRNRSSNSENSQLATGTYTGSGKNVTYNQTGDFLLRVDSVDSSGNVRAYFEASNGLTGRGSLSGTMKDGKLELSGTSDDGKSVAVVGTVSGNTISAGYGIAKTGTKTQSGNFTVTRR